MPAAPGQPHIDPAACAAQFPAGAAMNDFPTRIAQAGALANLYAWVERDVKPPRAPRILVDKSGRARLDSQGNALGGLRLPQVSAPVATYGVGPQGPGLCALFGYRRAWSGDQLRALYKSRDAYLALVRAQVAALAKQRFLTREGASELIAQAQSIDF